VTISLFEFIWIYINFVFEKLIFLNTSFRVIGIFRSRSSIRSDGAKIDGTKWTELNAARSVGPKLKLHETGTKIINLFYLIKLYLVDDRPYFVRFFLSRLRMSICFSYVLLTTT
jgi:hypothetical protein